MVDGCKTRPDGNARRRDHGLWVCPLPSTIRKHPDIAKPLKGFGGTGVLELIANHTGDTYRAVYTVRYSDAIVVLHAFQKKSKRGIETPKTELDLISERLKRSEIIYHDWKKG